MTTIAIIGAGPLGRWLALAAARAGFRVFLEDVMPSNLHHAQEYLRQQLSPPAPTGDDTPGEPTTVEAAPAAPAGSGTPDEPIAQAASARPGDDTPGEPTTVEPAPAARAGGAAFVSPAFQRGESGPMNIASPVGTVPAAAGFQPGPPVAFVSTVEDAVREADLVIDCVPDELESKLEILWLLDRMAPPKTVIATPTTNLSIVDLAACTYRPEKCIAIVADPRALSSQAPGSPIRLQTSSRTTPEASAQVMDFWRRLGFHPSIELAPE